MKKEEKGSKKKTEDAPPEQTQKPARRKTTAKPGGSSKKKETIEPAAETTSSKKTHYWVKFFYEWCKSCGICSALCPKNVILLDELGRPYIEIEDDCIGCRNCEMHCPDFAITVKKRYPERRETNGK